MAAHALTRALYGQYNGPLYQVKRSNGDVLDIGVKAPGGVVNSAAQDAFCAGTSCVVQRIYDQSPRLNHLDTAPPGGEEPHPDAGVNATRSTLTIGGSKAYAARFETKMGYRIDVTNGIAKGNNPETTYMVTSGRVFNSGCCMDYGNAETDNHDDGAGTMQAVYFGSSKDWGYGAGAGPWVMADQENGLFAGNERYNPNNTPMTSDFVTAMVKGGTNGFALKAGDSQAGGLQVKFDGPRPAGYQPMKLQGAIILGIGGDNSWSAIGVFYEGCIVQGYTTDAADDAVQANIVAAGYKVGIV